jgi:formylglycine-generating enzyme required for sulfatase activity
MYCCFLAPLGMLVGRALPAYPVEIPDAARTLPAVTVRGASFELVRIPPGEFEMGSDSGNEKPRHKVQVRSFDLGRTEVTVRQFRAFVQATGYRTEAEKEGWAWVCCWSKRDGASWLNPGFPQSEDDPVVALSWHDAVAFCKWLSAETAQEYRLPSEAEWEYAARAGSQAEIPSDPDPAAWYKDNSDGRTHPVAQKQPNAWGVFDMLGNGWEWVADVFSEGYAGAPTDGSARRDGGSAGRSFTAGDGRALRGGAWGLGREALSLAGRAPFGSHERCNNSGFRIARRP